MIIADLSKAACSSLPFIWSSSRTRIQQRFRWSFIRAWVRAPHATLPTDFHSHLWGNLKVVSGKQRDLKHPTCSTSVQDSRPGWTHVSCEQQLTRTMQMFSVHVGGGSSRPNEALCGFGVPPLPCCPEKCPAVRSDLFRVSSPYKWFHFIQTIWLQLNSGHVWHSLLYQLCLRAVRRTQQLVGGHITLGEHFDPATEKEIALWSGGDEMGRGHAELCLCNWGLTDPLQGAACKQSMEEYRIPLPHIRGARRWSRPKWNQISCFPHSWHELLDELVYWLWQSHLREISHLLQLLVQKGCVSSLLRHLWLKSAPAVVKNGK